MKNIIQLMSLAIAVVVLAGCGNNDSPPETRTPGASASTNTPASTTVVAYDLGSKKKGDKGVCVVCNKIEGTTAEEEVVETLDYQGKTYLFCNESEKAEFISEPTRFVASQ